MLDQTNKEKFQSAIDVLSNEQTAAMNALQIVINAGGLTEFERQWIQARMVNIEVIKNRINGYRDIV